MGTPAKVKKVDYPVHEMKKNGKLMLPPHIISQITFLHSHCGTDEWSGMLLYDVVKGNPSDPKNFELEVKHIFLMDIGSAAATEYEPDGDIVDIYDNIPEAMEWKTGHIHTHHSGSAYFSSVDEGELKDNVDKHNYYLSLVVCFKGSYSAKVVFLSEVETNSKMTYLDDSGKTKSFKSTEKEKHMVSVDMDIYFTELGGFFTKRLKQVKKKKEDEMKAATSRRTHVGGFGGSYGPGGYGSFGDRQWDPKTQRMIPMHSGGHLRAISSKIIPDKMTSWEVDRLTNNILNLDADLKQGGNTYSTLHHLAREMENPEMSLFPEYLLNMTEQVIEAYFDDPLDNDETMIVLDEVMAAVAKYEAHPTLSDTVEMVVENLTVIKQSLIEEDDSTDEEDEDDIAKQLAKAEEELQNG